MKLTMTEINNLYFEINGLARGKDVVMHGLLKQKTSLKTKVYLQRLAKAIEDDYKLYESEKFELFKKYGQEKDGMLTVSPDKMEDFTKDLNELGSAEKDINVSTLWSTDLTLDNLNFDTDEFYPVFFKLIDNGAAQ